jgi:hypothetical protein
VPKRSASGLGPQAKTRVAAKTLLGVLSNYETNEQAKERAEKPIGRSSFELRVGKGCLKVCSILSPIFVPVSQR